MSGLTHFNDKGDAHMVDVSDKAVTARRAVAEGHIKMTSEAFDIVSEKGIKKGDVLAVAQLAGIQGAKKTADLIPCVILCRFRASRLICALIPICPVFVLRRRLRQLARPVLRWRRSLL